MEQALNIRLSKPLTAVTLVSAAQINMRLRSKTQQAAASAAAQKITQDLSTALGSLNNAAQMLNTYHQNAMKDHGREITKLAIQIAEKIVAKQVASGNYDIEAMICDVLSTTQNCDNLTVYVNPVDLAVLLKLQQDNASMINNVKLAPDASLKPAECRIDTGKGFIESLLDMKLKNIEAALLGLEGNNEAHNN